jgi:cytochrome c oxidase assembly protein subunit 15
MATTASPRPLQPRPTTRSGWLRSTKGAERFAWAVAGYNVLVAVWGVVVRATGSGDGCGSHWPLCNGVVLPVSPTLHTIIEFVHRQTVTVSVGAMILLFVWAFRATARGWAARVFLYASTVLLLNEAFLGAMLVVFHLTTGNRSVARVVVLSIHLSNTLLMLAAMTMTAWMLRTGQRWRDLHAIRTDKFAAFFGLAATLVVGVSGSLAALGDTLFPAASLRAAFAQDLSASSPWLLRVRGVHPASALVAAAFVLWLCVRARRTGLTTRAALLGGLLALQFCLGLADVLLLAPTWMQLLHLLGADLYWIALVVVAAEVLWPLQGRTVSLDRSRNVASAVR